MPSPGLRKVRQGAAIVGILFTVTAIFLFVGGDRSAAGGGTDRGRELAALAMATVAVAAFLVACLCSAVVIVQQWRLHRQREIERLSAAERRADIAIRRARIRAGLRDFR